MAWWIWVVVGGAFLVAEVVISTDFYLVFLGVAAIVLGLLGLFGLHLPTWGQFLLFAALAAVLSYLYQRRWKPRLTIADRELGPEFVGELGRARADIAAGGRGKVDLRGSVWDAINGGDSALASGDYCEVVRVDGLTLHVRAEKRA